MGSSIAQRLMSVGHEVGVWNRDSAKTKPLIDAGAKLSASPAELVEGCEIVIVMLLNDAASKAVYRGRHGPSRHDEIERLFGGAAKRCVRRMSGGREHRPSERGQAVRSGRGYQGRC